MGKVLYAEYKDYENEKNSPVNHQKDLIKKLTDEEIDFTLLGKDSKEKKEILNIFDRDIKPVLGMYHVFIAHMGAQFQDQIENILNNYPMLKLIVVTDFPNLYIKSKKNNRFLICDYTSEKLIPFIKGD